MTGGVVMFLYSEVFSSDSKTSHFNRAVNRVKKDSRCTELLGSSNKIKAYGEPTWNKWARARPIASTVQQDRGGADHLIMHFNVEGPLNTGVVNLHMIKQPNHSDFEYKYLALDVKGHPRIYLENANAAQERLKKKGTTIFGIRWR
ncbi:MAG: mitochondrial import inner membrane translocase subunit tim21 [Pleopsidium flavum]|nr:MAG: mitochondrial import inner membrane translocase subunit tim21 [Pleopsidium flavum]